MIDAQWMIDNIWTIAAGLGALLFAFLVIRYGKRTGKSISKFALKIGIVVFLLALLGLPLVGSMHPATPAFTWANFFAWWFKALGNGLIVIFAGFDTTNLPS